MITRTRIVGGFLCATSLFIVAPAAHADTGSSSLGALINVGCLLQTLSAESPTADCKPPQIPVAAENPAPEAAAR
ncbi:hypothetical protein ACFYO1_32590 [Nocardia sp. NPDC006044]|uniref:hypothetical protein n=1 Tax=Nocardia sp. NPDC006044 TaxID=3364306 RepID=UPI0036A5AA5D